MSLVFTDLRYFQIQRTSADESGYALWTLSDVNKKYQPEILHQKFRLTIEDSNKDTIFFTWTKDEKAKPFVLEPESESVVIFLHLNGAYIMEFDRSRKYAGIFPYKFQNKGRYLVPLISTDMLLALRVRLVMPPNLEVDQKIWKAAVVATKDKHNRRPSTIAQDELRMFYLQTAVNWAQMGTLLAAGGSWAPDNWWEYGRKILQAIWTLPPIGGQRHVVLFKLVYMAVFLAISTLKAGDQLTFRMEAIDSSEKFITVYSRMLGKLSTRQKIIDVLNRGIDSYNQRIALQNSITLTGSETKSMQILKLKGQQNLASGMLLHIASIDKMDLDAIQAMASSLDTADDKTLSHAVAHLIYEHFENALEEGREFDQHRKNVGGSKFWEALEAVLTASISMSMITALPMAIAYFAQKGIPIFLANSAKKVDRGAQILARQGQQIGQDFQSFFLEGPIDTRVPPLLEKPPHMDIYDVEGTVAMFEKWAKEKQPLPVGFTSRVGLEDLKERMLQYDMNYDYCVNAMMRLGESLVTRMDPLVAYDAKIGMAVMLVDPKWLALLKVLLDALEEFRLRVDDGIGQFLESILREYIRRTSSIPPSHRIGGVIITNGQVELKERATISSYESLKGSISKTQESRDLDVRFKNHVKDGGYDPDYMHISDCIYDIAYTDGVACPFLGSATKVPAWNLTATNYSETEFFNVSLFVRQTEKLFNATVEHPLELDAYPAFEVGAGFKVTDFVGMDTVIFFLGSYTTMKAMRQLFGKSVRPTTYRAVASNAFQMAALTGMAGLSLVVIDAGFALFEIYEAKQAYDANKGFLKDIWQAIVAIGPYAYSWVKYLRNTPLLEVAGEAGSSIAAITGYGALSLGSAWTALRYVGPVFLQALGGAGGMPANVAGFEEDALQVVATMYCAQGQRLLVRIGVTCSALVMAALRSKLQARVAVTQLGELWLMDFTLAVDGDYYGGPVIAATPFKHGKNYLVDPMTAERFIQVLSDSAEKTFISLRERPNKIEELLILLESSCNLKYLLQCLLCKSGFSAAILLQLQTGKRFSPGERQAWFEKVVRECPRLEPAA